MRTHIVDGYTLNEQRLREESAKLRDMRQALDLLAHTLNKRIAAAVFIAFLARAGILYRAGGGKRLADNALVALTLLIAESRPEEKDTLVKLIVNLINRSND